MKQIFYILIFLPLICIGQTISIDGSLHSTNGENTFPIWVEEGTTIQPNYPIKSISIKEFNVVPNSNGNDLFFNKTVLVYSDSVSTVPEGKTWKLESTQNGLQLGDEYAGGIVFYLDGNGGGKVFAKHAVTYTYWTSADLYCQGLVTRGFEDWYLPSNTDLMSLATLNINNKFGYSGYSWSSDEEGWTGAKWAVEITTGYARDQPSSQHLFVFPIRQF